MRLICPNCDAEYEVDASVIPEAGRDVQCSNCGHAWFQLPPDLGPSLIDSDDEIPLRAAQAAAAVPDSIWSQPAPVVAPPPPGDYDDEDAADDEDGAPAPAAPARARQFEARPIEARAIEGSVLSVLREEAERETAARRAEAPAPIETQTDLDLPAPVPAVKRTLAPSVAPPPAPAPQASAGAAPPRVAEDAALRPNRGGLLPDIEEINSTLRPVDDSDGYHPDPTAGTEPERGGFATGFFLMLTLACALVAIYVLAPRVAEQIPAAAPALDQFVATVDDLRIWLDGMMHSAIGAINGGN